MSAKALLFDLDGTLLDTLDDLAASVERALKAHGLPGHPLESYRYFIGNGMAKLAERAVPAGTHPSVIQAVHEAVRADYAANWAVKTKPYPGIIDLIDTLSRKPSLTLMVLTNKTDEFAGEMVRHYFPARPFHTVRGQREGFPIKPAPDAALAMLAQVGLSVGRALFIGDSSVDMQTACNAGIPAVGVSWGFRPVAELEANGAGHIIDRPDELLSLLE